MFVFLPSYDLIFFATRLQEYKGCDLKKTRLEMRTRSLSALPQLKIWASVVACNDSQDHVSPGFENMDATKWIDFFRSSAISGNLSEL
jgi:hypothetical protein